MVLWLSCFDACVCMHDSGYVDVANDGPSKSYFYWFFESRSSPSTDPLIVWLTGGPGTYIYHVLVCIYIHMCIDV